MHLPFLARLQVIGQASLTAAAQTAGATAVAGVTAVTLLTPVAAAATPPGVSAGRSARQSASTTRADVPTPMPAPSLAPHPQEPSDGHDQGHGPSPTGSTSGGAPGDGGGSEGSGNSGEPGDGGDDTGGSGNSGPGSGGLVVVLPIVPDLIGTLRAEIVAAGLDQHTSDDLTGRLDDVAGKLDDGKIQDACGDLSAFVARVQGDSGGHAGTIDAISVALWTTEAQTIASTLGC